MEIWGKVLNNHKNFDYYEIEGGDNIISSKMSGITIYKGSQRQKL